MDSLTILKEFRNLSVDKEIENIKKIDVVPTDSPIRTRYEKRFGKCRDNLPPLFDALLNSNIVAIMWLYVEASEEFSREYLSGNEKITPKQYFTILCSTSYGMQTYKYRYELVKYYLEMS